MGLPDFPIVKKFFTNKIESSCNDWGDYLLEIADIFSMFDGEDLDRKLISDHFLTISGRSPYALRDASNFRDEFGAYGTYLGVFHYTMINGKWKVFLSKAAKHFLCSTEPDVESFCRLQLSLFQYPNGAGAVLNQNMRVQANAYNDTLREVENNIHINPLRLLCRVVIVMHELLSIPLNEIEISYDTIFMLFNDDLINQTYSPSYEAIAKALASYEMISQPDWVKDKLTNFKRNFHIMTRTGIFERSNNKRSSNSGLSLKKNNIDKAYEYAKEIASMNNNFDAFDICNNSKDWRSSVYNVISSPRWGEYYDALSISMDKLSALSDDLNVLDVDIYSDPIGTMQLQDTEFPEMKIYKVNQIRTFMPSDNHINPYETLVRREKANREHSRILSMLAAKIRLQDLEVYENTYIDLFTVLNSQPYIFEIKSNNNRNTISQIRKAIAQLYEYRYRCKMKNAILCIVLQQKPTQSWIEDYLLNDRDIKLCWLVDGIRLEAPNECYDLLSNLGIIG